MRCLGGICLKKLTIFILCVALFALSGCNVFQEKETHSINKAHRDEVGSEVVKINQDDELKIIPLYSQYIDYLENSLDSSSPEVDKKNYYKYVLNYFDKIGEQRNINVTELKANGMLQATTYKQEQLDRVNKLMKKDAEIKSIIKKSFIKAHKVLPKKKSTIFIVPVSSEYLDGSELLKGVMGVAYKDCIVFFLDENYDKDILAYATAHEYHHTILYDNKDFRLETILQSCIAEGKADEFAKRVIKGVRPPTDMPLENKTKENIIKMMNKGEVTGDDILLGNDSKNIPMWSNYRLGKDIMESYLNQNPSRSIADWTFDDEKTILKGYKYKIEIE